MPLSVDGSDEPFHDGFVTATTTRSKLLIVTFPAEGLAVFLVEAFRSKVLATQCAEEVLWMPCPVQSSHHTLHRERERERERDR